MKLKNKLYTNDFFITAKNDNKEITCIYIVFIYIFCNFYTTIWNDLNILTFNIIWIKCVWNAILLYYKISIFLNITYYFAENLLYL